jgi:hypothetical protein
MIFLMSFNAARILLASALFLGVLGTAPANAAAPKPGSNCVKSGQLIRVNSLEFTCTKSGKKLVWSKGMNTSLKPTSTPTPKQGNQNPQSTIQEGFLCDGKGPPSGKDGSGRELFCTKGGDGKYSWRPQQSGTHGGSGSQGTSPTEQQQMPSDNQFLYGRRIGMNCSTNGVFGFTGGMLAVCRDKKVSYALQSDIPEAPAGGYKTRPSWYPSLAQQLGKMKEPSCAPSSIRFTSPVIPLNSLAPSVPYGAMIGGHVTPIDHAYLGVSSLYKEVASRTDADFVPVTSPADGVITSIGNLGSPTSIRIVIEHGCNVATVYMVLNRLSGVLSAFAEEFKASGANRSVNIPVKAGEEFGRQRDNMLDFNVWDGTQWLSDFANPFSYTSGEAWKPFTADPLPFFSDPIRSAMEAQMQKTTAPRMGKIDHDISGTASGNWFLDGTFGYSGQIVSDVKKATAELMGGQVKGKNDASWSHLAIAPHEVDSNNWIFSTGWWQDPAGDPQQFLLNATSGKPTPDKLTTADGMVVYQLTDYSRNEPIGSPVHVSGSTAPYAIGYKLEAGYPRGIVALQVNPDGSLSVEISTTITNPSGFAAFTSAKRVYRH